ncbi:MAG: GDP-L-fucose synthase [Caenispirillum sp.]|nr:GDP-L-fucose synthase [Caenispirillum sp.]
MNMVETTTAARDRFSLDGRRVLVAGHTGMVGRALLRRLRRERCEAVTVPRSALDLRRQKDVEDWMHDQRPDVVLLAAARVGGIMANSEHPAQFLRDNLAISSNVIHAAHLAGVKKLLFIGSSCIYPREAPQPIREEHLLTGPLEPTNQWFAIAKIAALKMCQAYRREYGRDFITVMSTNLYGPGDNFDPAVAHVPAALIRRFHEAKVAGADAVTVWGTGRPLREFLYVDDMADGCLFALQHWSAEEPVNLGSGCEVSIGEFARLVADTVGFRGRIEFDTAKPDGTPRKKLDVSRMTALGWRARTSLRDGLAAAYRFFLSVKTTSPTPGRSLICW